MISNTIQSSVASIDLTRAAQRSEELRDWPAAVLEEAVDRYAKFLLLVRKHPEECVAPSKDIDAIWHLHMQHPRAYFDDCMRLFGEILDHDGGFGVDADELPVLEASFARTAALWEQEYSEPYVAQDAQAGMTKCTRNCVSRCQRACKTK
ncbi:MAG: glycine-rich domain-containing protein-like [Phycisphaerales bacterium]|nr:glycine-rich domain-containing protein-like [Phycisphaerales bacterium]MCI0676070.1 glycine-rich domain-containing protein-like [Phycisphaerales bacterium]